MVRACVYRPVVRVMCVSTRSRGSVGGCSVWARALVMHVLDGVEHHQQVALHLLLGVDGALLGDPVHQLAWLGLGLGLGLGSGSGLGIGLGLGLR